MRLFGWLATLACCLSGPVLGSSYVLKSGDLLRIEVMEDASLNRNALVLPDGTIAFPMVGQVRAAGLTLGQLRDGLTAGLAPQFSQRPSLHVAVASLAKRKAARVVTAAPSAEKLITVFGMGELVKPGRVQVRPGTSLMQFLAQAGGTTSYAAMKRVQVRRTADASGQVTTYRVNVAKLMRGSGQSFPLAAGDVVIVPERKLFE